MRQEEALNQIPKILENILDMPVEDEYFDELSSPYEPDLMLQVGGNVFIIDYRPSAGVDQVSAGVMALKYKMHINTNNIPLLVVPYMGETGKMLCANVGVSWMDLSGNANIKAPGVMIRIEGHPNRYKQLGRPVDLFAPNSSRLARILLMQPDRVFSQIELAEETGMDIGNISRLIRRYEEAEFVHRDFKKNGNRASIRLANFDHLLDTWRQEYDFSMHEICKGHISARSGIELLHYIALSFQEHAIKYAATGLAGAWLLEPFATFRLVTVYVPTLPSAELLEKLRFNEEPKGSNIWLVRPRDEGVFMGMNMVNGIHHVSPIQIYIDLKAQPERSEEAAEELRRAIPKSGWNNKNV